MEIIYRSTFLNVNTIFEGIADITCCHLCKDLSEIGLLRGEKLKKKETTIFQYPKRALKPNFSF